MILNKNDADLAKKFISKAKQDSKKCHKEGFSKDSDNKIKTCYLCGSKESFETRLLEIKKRIRANEKEQYT